MLLSGWLKPRSRSIHRSRRRRGDSLGGIRDWLLEDRCLLSGVLVPGNSNTPLKDLFWNGGAPQQGAPYTGPIVTAAPTVKTITITNNSDQTIYPILRDANTGQDPANTNPNNPKNYYDPEDPIGQEYRAYIGYVGPDGKEYLGLPAGATITIRVPLVFWDAENTYIATDGTDLTPANPTTQSNPFRYNPSSARGVSLSTDSNSWVTSFTDSTGTDSVGLVMFYHAATSQTPSLDSPSQLTEFTIRDPYLNTGGMGPNQGWLTDSAQTKVLFNYDVSYVDNLTSSIAMEAYNVPIPIANNPTPPADNYGWAGSSLIYGPPTTSGTIQNLIQNFINNTGSASIGQYFGGNGWPSYYNPDGILKIPGGANLFANSPLNGQLSSYATYGPNNAFMLTSGGTGPVSASSGGAPLTNSQPTQLPLTLTTDQRAAFVSNMEAMLANNQEVDLQYALAGQPLSPVVGTVTAYDPFAGIQAINVTNGGSGYDPNHPPTVIITPADGKGGGAIATAFVNASGQITAIGIDPNNRGSYDLPPIISFSGTNQSATATADLFGGTATVKLNSGVNLPTNQPLSYVFSRPATDYASTAITNLWYSWAQYYVNQFTNFVPPPGVTGSIAAGTNVLTLDSPAPSSLAVGMTVSGLGIDPAPGTTVTILGFNPDNVNQIYLSQLSASGSSSGTSYTFGAPQALPFANTDGIKSITVTNPGSGYTPATVTFSGGGGSGAAGTVITSNGQVTGVVLTNYGSGYTSAPTVTFNGGSTLASGTAAINSKTGLVTGVTITNGGSGYLSVNIGGPTGSGASAIATVDPTTGSITNVKVINAGGGYNSNNPPSVTFTGGGGSGATAAATVGSFVKTFSLTFPTDQQAYAQAFAGSVYEAMEAESAIPNYTAKNPLLPGAYSLVYTTLGTDTLDLPNSNGGGSLVGTLVTNLIKSILRGVPDFTNPLYSNPSQWYPNPSYDPKTGEPTGGQKFNVYNLDPYVWFVHTVLGLSGYGFSVDDDTSDVDASASPYTPQNQQVLPNNLQFVFSGLKPTPFNQNEWFPSVPWGTVSDTGIISNPTGGPYAKFTIITLTNPLVYYKITNPDLTAGQIGAYVSGPGIPQGTTVTVRQRGDLNSLMLVLNTQIPNLQTTSGTFTFTGAPSSPPLSPPPPLGSPPPSPPPSSSPPGGSVNSSSTPSALQELILLAQDEFLMILNQVVSLADRVLGLVPDPALANSIAAYTNAINANPEVHTLLGQEVINFSFFEALNLLQELTE
ncbi:MAG TPA: hypothetical protein VH643_28650 [Gemmataceae bacterium]